MKYVKINVGDPQPIDCHNCKAKHGYQITDNIRTQYTCFYDENGKDEGGDFSEYQPITRKGTTVFCANCHKKMNIKVIRD